MKCELDVDRDCLLGVAQVSFYVLERPKDLDTIAAIP